MRAPLSWIREMTPIDPATPAEDLAAELSALGLVVEGLHRVGEGLGEVVVARVLAISPIEGADRIRHVVVDAGAGELGIVCGAWNFSEGDLVPLARVGAVLPGGFEIGRRKLRGVTSEGMLCSGRELGLSDDAAGLLVLEQGLAPGMPIADALGIVRDVVFELEIAPNRPDALSIAGIARDLAAGLGLPFVLPEPSGWLGDRQDRLGGDAPARPEAAGLARVAVEAPELCTRLTGRVLQGVRVGPSPASVAARLTLCGMRPINAIVDASNYVMLELGQPTHPYDLDLVGGALVARAAREGEKLVTLDGAERTLGPGDCVIADGHDRAVGVGGVMGGADTEITEATTRVLLEAAHFVPLAIARTARRLGLRTEASVRFERGCDPEVVELAQARFCQLVTEAAEAAGHEGPTVAHGLLDARPVPAAPTVVGLRTDRVNGLLGTALGDEEIDRLLAPIGFEVTRSGAGAAQVRVPSFRPDVTREVDVVEEVARLHGYEKVARTQVRAPGVGRLTPHQQMRRELRRLLASLGAHEAWTPTFLSPEDHARAKLGGPGEDEIRLTNPLAAEESVLRKGLLPGLLKGVAYNAARRNPYCRLFEIGHVFAPSPGGGLPVEVEVAAVAFAMEGDDAASAVRAWRSVADGLAVREVSLDAASPDGLHPTRSAYLREGERVIGAVGEVDPEVLRAFGLPHERVGWLVTALEPLLELAGRRRTVGAVSRFPSSDIDLAFVVEDDVPADKVQATLAVSAGELCESVVLFDVYRGPGMEAGRRSLAFRLRFCADDRTLTDAEVADLRQRCIRAVEESLPAVLRG